MSQVRSAEEILYLAAGRLGHLRERVVFVGGAVRGLLITDPAVEGPRPTKDVDVIVEVSPRSAYFRLEEELRDLGFKNDTREGAPQCRFVHGELTLDVMPTDAATLGFSNPWYPHALRTAWSTARTSPSRPSSTPSRLTFAASRLHAASPSLSAPRPLSQPRQRAFPPLLPLRRSLHHRALGDQAEVALGVARPSHASASVSWVGARGTSLAWKHLT